MKCKKTKIFSITTVNALTSTQKIIIIIIKNSNQPSIKKKNIILFLFLLVNDYILMYLKTTILCIYNFLILYGYLLGGFFFFFLTLVPASLKFWVHLFPGGIFLYQTLWWMRCIDVFQSSLTHIYHILRENNLILMVH